MSRPGRGLARLVLAVSCDNVMSYTASSSLDRNRYFPKGYWNGT